MSARECQIRCRAKRGVFDDEAVVRIPTVDSAGHDSEAECLAYGDTVKRTGEEDASGEADAILRAYCLGEKDDLVAIVLPQSTFQNGPSVIVRKSELLPNGEAR